MARLARVFLLALVNEALSAMTTMRIKSKAEIMSKMTEEEAVRTVLGLNRTHTSPALVSIIHQHFGHLLYSTRNFRGRLHPALQLLQEDSEEYEDDEDDRPQRSQFSSVLQMAQNAASDTSESTAAANEAEKMLNTMIMETSMKMELEQSTCGQQEIRQVGQMNDAQQDVSSFNSLAAESRGSVIKAQGSLGMLDIKITKDREEQGSMRGQCTTDKGTLRSQIEIVKGDIEVMGKILEMTQCNGALFMVQCTHCNGAVMLQHDTLQPLLQKLKSRVANEYLDKTLKRSYEEGVQEPVALTQEGVRHIRRITGHHMHHLRNHRRNTPAGGVNTSDSPASPEPHDCLPTSKCTIGDSKDCGRLRDRFLVIQAEIVDKKSELDRNLVNLDKFCQETDDGFTAQLNGLTERVREENTNMAVATKDQNDAESSSHLKAEEHSELVTEHSETQKECCDSINAARSEICALEKIRGQLQNIAGNKLFTTDCEVSDWRPEECTVTCGGGKMKKIRSVIVQPAYGGTPCLPLEDEEDCNVQDCPIDCEVNDWSGWSDCSAQCGGGVRERSRTVKVQPKHGGEPCDATEEEESCNMQSCNADCILNEWSSWGACSRACGGGQQVRNRGIAHPAQGTGVCWEPESEQRQNFKGCNPMDCLSLLPAGRSVLKCESKVDLIILLDGSGSLRSYGWEQSALMAKTLVENLEGGDEKVLVSLQLFSGPTTWNAYDMCTGAIPGTPDLEKDCGIKWVSHFTSDMSTLASNVASLEWPAATTLTSVALGQAESEIKNGREDANTIVVVITDGWPMSQYNTWVAAERLQEKARVVWMPVGQWAPHELIWHMASQPQEDHILAVNSFEELAQPNILNKLITSTCPYVA